MRQHLHLPLNLFFSRCIWLHSFVCILGSLVCIVQMISFVVSITVYHCVFCCRPASRCISNYVLPNVFLFLLFALMAVQHADILFFCPLLGYENCTHTLWLILTHPRRNLWHWSHGWPCSCTFLLLRGRSPRSWSDGSASSVWRPGQSAGHQGARLHPSSAGWWCQGDGSRSRGKSGCFFAHTFLGHGCTPEPWVEL